MKQQHPSSYKDPSGYVFTYKNKLFREIDVSFIKQYTHFMQSGLYNRLVKESLLIPHREVKNIVLTKKGNYVIKPLKIPFISYPYEWCFSQLKDAALLTLKIQKIALEYNMTLRDATSFNIAFYKGSPIYIDTLSFGFYKEGKPWDAYRQFCEHFLAPLALMAYRDVRLSLLLEKYINGIPLNIALTLLPWYRKLQPGILLHLGFHGKSQQYKKDMSFNNQVFPKSSLMGLLGSLESTVKSLVWHPDTTMWSEYETQQKYHSYTRNSIADKKRIVRRYLSKCRPKTVLDVGANRGEFSTLASGLGASVISIDTDPSVVEYQYQQNHAENTKDILPLCIDVTNPTPSIGWANEERLSFLNRIKPDVVIMLATLHHIAISNNIPFKKIAEFLSRITKYVIIEFVPKTDRQVREMLTVRQDIFTEYTEEQFQTQFGVYFSILSSKKIAGSQRTIYVFKKKES